MFCGKRKALTFSYDDGVLQDKRIIEIFNKYNLKATFNLNSGALGHTGQQVFEDGKIIVDHTKVKPEEVAQIYKGHEVAAHTLTHPRLCNLSDEDVVLQVEEDCKNLSRLVGYEVCGMAYPGGNPNHDERVVKLVQNHTSVKYARTIDSTYSFELQDDLYQFNPTIFHMDWKNMFELAEKFIALEPDKPALYYIWGHSYEFDIYDEWSRFEEFCKLISNRNDIFYGTNKEVFRLAHI